MAQDGDLWCILVNMVMVTMFQLYKVWEIS